MKTTYEECTYFELLRKADGERDTYSGECRLHPPLRQAQLTARAAYLPLGGWPLVHGDDWCGDGIQRLEAVS